MSKKPLLLIVFLFLVLTNLPPAYAQKTGQKASKPQVFIMVIFTAIGMKALSYLKVP